MKIGMATEGLRSALEELGLPMWLMKAMVHSMDQRSTSIWKILSEEPGSVVPSSFDFQLPQRFELEYTGADGEKHRPIMIHRVVFGSIERFIGILIEHFG